MNKLYVYTPCMLPDNKPARWILFMSSSDKTLCNTISNLMSPFHLKAVPITLHFNDYFPLAESFGICLVHTQQ